MTERERREREEAKIRWIYSELTELVGLAVAENADSEAVLKELEGEKEGDGATANFVRGEIRTHEGWIFHACRLLNVLRSVLSGYDPFDADDEAFKWLAERPGPPSG